MVSDLNSQQDEQPDSPEEAIDEAAVFGDPQAPTDSQARIDPQSSIDAESPESPAVEAAVIVDLPEEVVEEDQATGSEDPVEDSVDEKTEPEPDPETIFQQSSVDWRSEFAERLSSDDQEFRELRVSLANVHPGGLAQLYVDHPTHLQTLVREETAYEDAAAAIRRLVSRAADLEQLYGRGDVHLVMGTAFWDGAPSQDVPVLMRRAVIEQDDHGQITITLQPGVEASTRLLRAIADAGRPLDPGALGRAMHGFGGFQPRSALALISEAGRALPGFELKDGLLLGVFTHPAGSLYRELNNSVSSDVDPLVRSFAGDPRAREMFQASPSPANPSDRDPWRELGLGDQTPQMQDVIEQVAAGGSVYLSAKSAGQQSRVAASVAAALTEVGKRVVIVLNRPDEYQLLMAALRAGGVDKIAADLSQFGDPQLEAQKLTELLDMSRPPEDDPQIAQDRSGLLFTRDALGAYTDLLHTEFDPWGSSPFDALQVLTDLTAMADPPKTKIRLPLPALLKLAVDGGDGGATLLERASELGLFDQESSSGAWQGVLIENAEDVGPLLGAIGRLENDILPAMRMQMSTIAARLSLRPTVTLAQWQKQLGLLTRVRDCLDIFQPQVLERSPANLVVATASKQWRKERSINLSGSELRSLQRQAKDSVRPGVHVTDLHEQLVKAQEIRQDWKAASTSEEYYPVVPNQMQDLLDTMASAQSELEVIKPLIEPVYGDTSTMSIDELSNILGALYANPDGAAQIPELLSIMDRLDELGLHDLVLDLRARGVEGQNLRAELELSWWASALGFMLAAEPRLGGLDPAGLESMLQKARDLDQKQVASLGPALVGHVLSRAYEALNLYPEQRAQLAEGLRKGLDLADLFGSVNLAWDLQPIVITGPVSVTNLVRRGRRVDSMIILDLEGITKGQLVPLLPRAQQVVVIQDPARCVNAELQRSLSSALPNIEVPREIVTSRNLVSELIRRHDPNDAVTLVPSPRSPEPIKFVYVDGRGMPGPGVYAIETSSAEVEVVADLVEQQIAQSPDEFPVVVVFSDRHAARMAAELHSRAKTNAELSRLLQDVGGPEALVVFPEQIAAQGVEHAIVSVGYAKTPHGRVIHDFGVLSSDDGLRTMTDLAAGLRGDVTLVSSLRVEDMDQSRMRKDGELILLDLLKVAEQGLTSTASGEIDESQAPPQLLIDLAERLHQLGLRVVPNFGPSAGLRVPLAIGHPEVPNELLVAVLTDDDTYINQLSHRIRGRHWPKMLEDQGWRVHTALSMSVFIDPNREAQEIVQLALDAVDEYYARHGMPETPAAAAALGVEMEFPEPQILNKTTVEPETPADDQRVTERDFTGALKVIKLEDDQDDGGDPDNQPSNEPKVRGPRPPYATGLPLAAYSDDQLDEFATWILSDGVARGDDDLVEELREELGITRRGAQTDAVLSNVVRRSRG